MKCSCCGKEIPVGDGYYKIPGLIYTCCSKGCLLECYTNYEYRMNTGDTDDE